MIAMSGRLRSRAHRVKPRTLPDGPNHIMLEHDRFERAPMKHYFPDEHGRGSSGNEARAGSRKAKIQKPARPKRRRRKPADSSKKTP
jgi:hypothetical protein